ncbi:type IX secretion system membrane protein PorP/SprF [Maribacter sp. MJ134]|uniref:PorP/SprF family type IX secretion system membrane protein n=1 Tax=Maribacter sp. MJ134 TaxID=2496865 RepID=UPI000F834659|nr:type IX secretion system membrane protein PorP/SprF [Maribacter sp. MJ134]AZQ57489.1 type IX secretion system membrane protein PorP/SprF [Maribacter sp. MJ134]
MKLIRTIILVVTCSLCFTAIAQQESQYSQYMLNPLLFNPAYAGSREVISIASLYRAQWLGIDGAPSTQNISIHAPVKRRVGLGFTMNNDAIGNGTVQTTDIKGIFSYTLPLNRDLSTRLAFGISAGGLFNEVNLGNLVVSSNQTNEQGTQFSPNFGLGLFLRNPKYYVGLSTPNILQNIIANDNNAEILYQKLVTWHAIAGIILQTSPDWKIKPATLLKINSGAPLQLDISLNALYMDKLQFGASYRFGSSASALMGYHFTEKFFGGLAFDNELTDLGGQSFRGRSFEFFLRYEFEDRKCKCSPKPRFY